MSHQKRMIDVVAGLAAIVFFLCTFPAMASIGRQKEVAFIDSGVNDSQMLADGIRAGVEVVMLDPRGDKLAQIAHALSGHTGMDAIHVLSHGSPGALQIGALHLTAQGLDSHTDDLTRIGHALNPGGDILLYGCNVASGDSGLQFIGKLAQATGADIAASNNPTGSAELGGDWILEVMNGYIESTPLHLKNYSQILDLPSGEQAYNLSDFTDDGATLSNTYFLVSGLTSGGPANMTSMNNDGGAAYVDGPSAPSGLTLVTIRVAASNAGLASFELSDINISDYISIPTSSVIDLQIIGHKADNSGTVSSGTVDGTENDDTFTRSSFPGWASFSGVQLDYFEIQWYFAGNTPDGFAAADQDFVSFSVTNMTAPATGPTVTAISPNSGPAAGGTSVSITGTNLSGASSVTIGGTAATGVIVVNSTTITATTPAGSAGTADVAVTTLGGTGTGTGLFTYYAVPTVTAISPPSGPTSGGTSVSISGTNLSGATAVTIGGTAATGVMVVNSTTITAITPAGSAGAANVAVTTPGGTATGTGLFTYVAAPTVTAISPPSGPTSGGTSVSITGTNLSGASSVTIGGTAATGVTVVDSTTITATTPAGSAGATNVAVTTPGGMGTGTGLFTYYAVPTVTAISPNSGPVTGGTSVTITGTNLSGATSVTIGGTAATGVMVVNSTTITATTPAGSAGTANVTVTTPGGTGTGTGLFTYYAVPTVTAINPNSGPVAGGTSVTISGTNFTGVTSITIGGTATTGVIVENSTTITAMTPAGSTGAANVAVTTPGGTGTGTNLFTYYAVPTVTAINPNSGPVAGGTSVTITGTNLSGATSVTIDGTAATGVMVVNSTTITATTPAGSAGTANVAVTTPGGTGTGSNLFTYYAVPTVTAISPNSGPVAGGTSVTISGTNLTGATSVTIGGAAATGVSIVDATTINAGSPAGTVGVKNVVVTTPGGAGTGSNLFTYVAAPTVTSISPTSGPAAGGTAVTITGTNLASATSVLFGTTTATITANTATSVTATSPASTAGTVVDITVTTVGGTSATSAADQYTASNDVPVNTVVPVVSGTNAVTGSLSSDTGTWTDWDGNTLTYTYQWFRADDGVGNGEVAITGATNNSYTVTASDAHKYLRVVVTANDSHGSADQTATSTRTVIANTIPGNTVIPAINGTNKVGNTLTASSGTWTDTDGNSPTYTYQWQEGGSDLVGETLSILLLTTAQSKKTITCTVTANDGHGGTSSVTTVGILIANSAPVFTGTPSITGRVKVGNTLGLADTGTSDADGDTVTLSYQWAADGVDIVGATFETYQLTASEEKKTITCTLTADDSNGGVTEFTTSESHEGGFPWLLLMPALSSPNKVHN